MAVYLVKTATGKKLVESRTASQAINHVIKGEVTAEALNTSELVKLINNEGMKIEIAEKEEKPKKEAKAADAPAAAAPQAETGAAPAAQKSGIFQKKSA